MPKQRSLLTAYETSASPKPKAIIYGDNGIIELEMAEPSPVMIAASRLWKRFVVTAKTATVISLMGFYPAMMATGHNIDDTPVSLDYANSWASPEAGVAMTLIAREIHGAGWAADRADWHPQSRLVAMPAWQTTMMNALSEHTLLTADLVRDAGYADNDLRAASRLMKVEDGLYSGPRLMAAAEALARYEGLASENLAYKVSGDAALIEELQLFAGWAGHSVDMLAPMIGESERIVAGDTDIEAFYKAKAYAHVAHQMLDASSRAESKLMSNAAMRANIRRAETAWRRAAEMKPVFVYNGDADNFGAPSHLETMSTLLKEARTATQDLVTLLQEASTNEIYIAQLDTGLGANVTLP